MIESSHRRMPNNGAVGARSAIQLKAELSLKRLKPRLDLMQWDAEQVDDELKR